MKQIGYSMLRGVCALVLGAVLVLWPEATIRYIVMSIGACFVLPGAIALASHFTRNGQAPTAPKRFPVEAAGSILLGLWLMVRPALFVNILMYILGALLLVGALQQLIMLSRARQWSRVAYGFYVVPLLIFLTGILILTYPFEAMANTLVTFGVAAIFYGLAELLHQYRFRQRS